jgi:4-amino-4-deoxy-L-arabinose transferase-like glycosyltransferase
MTPAQAVRPQRVPFLLLAGALALCGYGLMWGLPNLFDFAQDSVVPAGTLAQMGFSFSEITAHRYPPFHFLLLHVAFLPARALMLLPGIGDNPKVSATLFILTARLLSVAMALGATWLIYRIGRRLWSEAAGLAGALFFILSPVTLYYAKNANLDMPSVFWLAASLLVYVRLLQEDRPRDYALLGLLAALAVCTKDQVYPFYLVMPVPVVLKAWPAPDRWRKLGLATAAAAVPFLLIHNILFRPGDFALHVQTIVGPASQPWQECARGPAGQARLLLETLLRLMDAWTLPGALLAAGGVAVALRESKASALRWFLAPAAAYHLAFIAVIGYVYPRFMLPVMVVLAPFAGRGIVGLWQWRPNWGKAAAVAVLAWVGLAGALLDHVMSDYERYDAQMWLQENATAETRIAYVGDMRDMPRFNAPLDPRAMEDSHEALRAAQPPPELIVLSFQQGVAPGSGSLRLPTLLRRRLGDWGRVRSRGEPVFTRDLLAGKLGYVVAARFESPGARFVPEVAESVNRTIIILRRAAP